MGRAQVVMARSSSTSFPWIPLFLWILLFALAVSIASLQPWTSPEHGYRVVALAGVLLTMALVWWITRRKAESETLDLLLTAQQNQSKEKSNLPVDPHWFAALEREAWFELLQTMGQEAKIDRFVRIIPPQIQQLFPGSSIGLYIRDSKETLILYLRSGDQFSGPATMHMSECEAMNRGQIIEDMITSENPKCTCKHHGSLNNMFVACIPIFSDDHFYGLVSIYHPLEMLEREGMSRSAILQKGQTLATSISLYLQNIFLKDALHQQKIRDTWTGLFNRRYLEETLFREFAEATRRRTTIGVVMVYPDQINAIRSTHGPKAAEQVAWEIGQRLPHYIRTEDIPCRYDEDLYCIILPGAALDISMQRGEKMRRELGSLAIMFQNHPVTTTFSVGVCMFPQHSNTVHGLIAMSEMAVRSAQRQGGNRIALPPTTTVVNWDIE